MTQSASSRWPKMMRHLYAGHFGEKKPTVLSTILDFYQTTAKSGLAFTVNALPISLNKMYLKNKDFKTKTKVGPQKQFRLHPKVGEFRLQVLEAMGEDRWKWRPTGTTAAVICFESPQWLTATRHVRQMDVDNKVKVLLDAIEHATETPDELHWHVHELKVWSKRKRTTVFLFDLGDIVEFYS